MLLEQELLTLKVMHLAYLVDVETSYCVFFDWSGHVQNFEMRVCESREHWRNKLFEAELSAKYREHSSERSPKIAYLKSCVDILLQILQDHEIPFEELDYEEEYVRHYTM